MEEEVFIEEDRTGQILAGLFRVSGIGLLALTVIGILWMVV